MAIKAVSSCYPVDSNYNSSYISQNILDVHHEKTEDILLSGYAKLPSNTTAEELYKNLVIVVEVNPKTGIIGQVECSLATHLAREFVSNLMVDYNLEKGINPLIKIFEEKYVGSARKAIITALKVMYERYIAYKKSA